MITAGYVMSCVPLKTLSGVSGARDAIIDQETTGKDHILGRMS